MKQRTLGPFDIFLIAGIIVCNIVYSVMSGEADPAGSAAAVAGVLCVVLVAKGSIWNYVFGVVNVSLYAWISWKASLYGDAALNALYYFPMQFIGWWQWRKRGASAKGNVQARRMTWPQRAALAAVCALLVTAGGFALRHFGDPQPFKDSATTVLSIVAQALMAAAFMEQWALWIITNVISVAMWCIFVSRGEGHAPLMALMWAFYLANSLNGLRVWIKLSDRREAVSGE